MYRKGEIGQVARALRVLDSLRGFKHGRWVSDVAKEAGASERTVRRDITELQDAGFDIDVTRRDNRSFACLATEQTFSSVPITKRERFTLLAVRSVFDVFQGTPFLEDVRSVMTKLEQRMSEKERAEHASSGERFIYMPDHGTKSYAGKEDIIDAIQTGILSRKVVRYRYADARGRARDGFLAPFGIAMYRHGLYAIGARLKKADEDVSAAPRGIFAIERFAEATHLRGHEFAVPAGFNMRDELPGSFGPHLVAPGGPFDVVVEFSRDKAVFATTRAWHPTQAFESTGDGWVRLSMCVPNLAPMVSWILEWGPHARAVAPHDLVMQVKTELEQARALYGR